MVAVKIFYAACIVKFAAPENPPQKFCRPQSGRKKIIRPPPDFCPAVEFDTVKFGTEENSLPEDIVAAPSVNSFENGLDKFWSTQELKYNW